MIDYGHGVYLGPVTTEDKDAFYNWRNDPHIWYWCRQNSPIDRAVHELYWQDVETSQTERFFAINSPNISCSIGCCGLTSIDMVNSRAEFSLYIGPEHQGQAYGVKAIKTLIDYGFGFLNLNCIWGETFEGNPALKMFKKLGMTVEGTRRQFYFRDGRYIDAFLISILRSEWRLSKLRRAL